MNATDFLNALRADDRIAELRREIADLEHMRDVLLRRCAAARDAGRDIDALFLDHEAAFVEDAARSKSQALQHLIRAYPDLAVSDVALAEQRALRARAEATDG